MKQMLAAGRSSLLDVDRARDQDQATPGKATLLMGGGEPPALTPASVHIWQYGPDCSPKVNNDCGPATVVMLIRAMGPAVRTKFEQLVTAWTDPYTKDQTLTAQKQFDYVRRTGYPGEQRTATLDSRPLRIDGVQHCLVAVLHELQIPDETIAHAQTLLMSGNTALPNGSSVAQAFLEENCGGGKAVIVYGQPDRPGGTIWPWGGQNEPQRTRDVKDIGGHFVLVWRPATGPDAGPDTKTYSVMDSSWAQPSQKSLSEVLHFVTNAGGNVHMLAVGFAELASKFPAAQAKPAPGATAAGTPPRASGGQPLPEPTLAKMERALGADLSGVRVLIDPEVAALGAVAFAQGSTLHFAPGHYRPGTPDGDRLIAHELAHVLQQRHGRVAGTGIVTDPALEAEADAAGERVAHGPPRLELRGGGPIDQLAAIQRTWHARAGEILRKAHGHGSLPPELREQLARDTTRVHMLLGDTPEEAIQQAAGAANDAIVEAYQALAVYAGESAVESYGKANDDGRMATRDALSKGTAVTDGDFCGELVFQQYAAAGLEVQTGGLGQEYRHIFNHVENVEDFFSSDDAHPTSHNVDRAPSWFIQPFGTGAWTTVAGYHAQRRSPRRIRRSTDVARAQRDGRLGDVMRPGDVVTFELHIGTSVAGHADHVAMVNQLTDDGFETIEGNTRVTNPYVAGNHRADRGIGYERYTNAPGKDPAQDASADNVVLHQGADNDADKAVRVYLIGRPSVVDFESGHRYAPHDPTKK